MQMKREYHSDGSPWYETPFNDQGQKHGVEKYWYTGGCLKYEVAYHQGQKHGTEKWWWANGQLESKVEWCRGQLHGVSKCWHKDGRPQKDERFVHNKKVYSSTSSAQSSGTCTCELTAMMNLGCPSTSGGICVNRQ